VRMGARDSKKREGGVGEVCAKIECAEGGSFEGGEQPERGKYLRLFWKMKRGKKVKPFQEEESWLRRCC